MLELLARELDAGVLVQIFRMLQGADPDPNHYALIATGAPVFTTKTSSSRRPRRGRPGHQHHALAPRCDPPDQIVTLLSQYVAGLPATTRRRFVRTLRGRRLLPSSTSWN